MIFVAKALLMKVPKAMAGMATLVGKSKFTLKRLTHSPSQKMCIRYMPKLSLESSVMMRGASGLLMQVKSRKVPPVANTQLMVHMAQPSSMTGVEWTTPGTAWM